MPFPHVERPVMVTRPAIVLTPAPVGLDASLIWTAMVTNAARAGWPGDIDIPEAETLGLLIPSKVRTAKLFTSEASRAIKIGQLDRDTWERVRDAVRRNLGF